MYKDNGNVDGEIDDDVQLIIDVGYIASRVRVLERSFFGSYFDVKKDQQNAKDEEAKEEEKEEEQNKEVNNRVEEFQQSLNNSLGNIINKCEESSSSQNQAQQHQQDPSRLRLLEDLVIKFYEDHKRSKQQLQQQKQQKQIEAKTGNIMNRSSEIRKLIATTSDNDKISIVNNQKNDEDDDEANRESSPAPASRNSIKFLEINSQNQNNNNKLNLSENIISGSTGDKSVITSRSEGNIENSYNNSKLSDLKTVKSDIRCYASVSSEGDGNGGISKTSNTTLYTSGNTTTKINEYKLIRLENTAIQYNFNDDDLRALVKELKRKVEYTERMNWLCPSKRQLGPSLRKCSLPKHQEVKKRFLEICDKTFSDEVKAALRLPAFDSYEWEDADVIHLMQTMFIDLGLIEKFNIPVVTLREWLYEVYKHYNEVPFHNFRHCFCVAQMMYAITRQANLIARLGDLEVLILLVSCICHDLDHPGYNNIYQINARTELALRYNDISPLENHHCSIAFRLLEHPDCNIFKHFNRETFNVIREGIIRCILATDMARHNEILTQFKEIIPVFDYSNRAHVNLLCMVLIKVADISNEARPMDVAEPWLDRLLQEFFAQSAAEKSEGLPVTPFMDPDKVSKPGSQVRFIGLVLLPLFEALGELLPELTELIIVPVRVALDYYKRLNDAQNKSRKSLAETTENSSDGGGSGSPQLPRSQSGISVRSRRSIPSQKSTSRNSVDEPTCIAAELHDLPEGSESGDSETATEVDVAEKTSKFKVDTESSNRSKSSHSNSRKPSREKRPSMISELCSSGGRIRNSYGNIHGYHPNRGHFGSNRAVSLDQYSSNNRRLSDGLQQVISDSNVFYNRHNRSLDNDGQSTFNTGDKPKKTETNQSIIGEDVLNSNASNTYFDSNTNGNKQQQLLQQQQVNIRNNSNGSHGSNGNHSQNGAKSWKARFKQITEYFSFGFEKTNKRFGSSARSSPCSLRNNNAEILKQQGICCTITNNLSPSLKKKQDLINSGRNRAYSLDVPARQRYSSSSGGDSRKSSKNDDNSNKHEDDNSNNTSSGAGGGGSDGIPTARIRGGSDGISDHAAMSLPKVITPSMEMENCSMDFNLIPVVAAGCSERESVGGGDGVPRI